MTTPTSSALPRDASDGEVVTGWRPINTVPKFTQVILGHDTKKWVRFGRQYPGHGSRWYYSGTNERSQYAQIEGDEPTHWMWMPRPPSPPASLPPDGDAS